MIATEGDADCLQASSLSINVQRRVLWSSISSDSANSVPWLTADGRLNWSVWTKEYLCALSVEEERLVPVDRDDGRERMEASQKKLSELRVLSEEDVTALHRALVRWRKGADYVHQYYEEHKSAQTFQQELCAQLRWIRPTNESFPAYLLAEREKSGLTAFVMLVSVLERILGDMVAWKTDDGKTQVPRRLNDVLVQPCLTDLLGSDVIFLLKLIVGPPQGANMRNIVWHGFLEEDEFKPAYFDFLIFLLMSLSEDITEPFRVWRLSIPPKHSRELLALDIRYDQFLPEFPAITALKDMLATNESLSSDLSHLFHNTEFIANPKRVSVWQQGVDDWIAGRYHRCLIVLLPQLEHSHRMLTAETEAEYTTLDVLIAPTVDEKTENKIFTSIPEPYLHLLYDLYMWWPEGPRFRDVLSHGLADEQHLSELLIHMSVMLCIALCRHFLDDSKRDAKPSPIEDLCATFVSTYNPYFHPIKYLQREMAQCHSHWEKYLAIVADEEDYRMTINKSKEKEKEEPEKKPPAGPNPVDGGERHPWLYLPEPEEKELQDFDPTTKPNLISHIHLLQDYIQHTYDTTALFHLLAGTPPQDKEEFSIPHIEHRDSGAEGFDFKPSVLWGSKEVTDVTLMRTITKKSNNVLGRLITKLDHFKNLIWTRKANKAQKKLLGKLRATMKLIGWHVALVMMLVEEHARHKIGILRKCQLISIDSGGIGGSEIGSQGELKSIFIREVLRLMGRGGSIRENGWTSLCQFFICWMNDPGTTSLLSKREISSFSNGIAKLVLL